MNEAPIDMILHCPQCHKQHIDAPKAETTEAFFSGADIEYITRPAWTNPPHRSHLCSGCGTIWRPADVPTNGVERIKTRGAHDTVNRGTGLTSVLIKNAPTGAVFVWGSVRLQYAHDLAAHLGRTDLRVISPADLERWRGGAAYIVIDHAAQLTQRQAELVRVFHRGGLIDDKAH